MILRHALILRSQVMLVCVNPFDSTCFDENLHVMRFSAVAREVQTSNKHATAATKIRLQAPGSSKEEEFELIEGDLTFASLICLDIDVLASPQRKRRATKRPMRWSPTCGTKSEACGCSCWRRNCRTQLSKQRYGKKL